MKCIAAVIRRFGTKSACLVMTLAALIAARNADAAWWGWKGSATSPSYWNESGNWYASKTSWDKFQTDTCNIHINPRPAGTSFENSLFVDGWDNVITFNENTSIKGPILFCAGSPNNPVVFKASEDFPDYGINSSTNLTAFTDANSPNASLKIASGTYVFDTIYIPNSTPYSTEAAPPTVTVGGETNATLSARYYITIGQQGPANLVIANGGLVNHLSNRYMAIGQNGDATVTITSGGKYENINGNGNAITANGPVTGTLNIAGGEFTIKGTLSLNYADKAVESVVTVTDGGVLTAKQITLRKKGTNGATLTLDGGTIKAYADNAAFMPAYDGLEIYAGSHGAIFDSNSHSVTIAEDIGNAPNDQVGSVKFTGGGTITFTGAANYLGKTTITAGTKLVVPASVKETLLTRRLEIEFPEDGAQDGTEVLELSDGVLTAEDVGKMTVTGVEKDRYALKLSEDGKKVSVVDKYAGEYIWNGGDSGDSWTSAGNWSKDGTPGDWYDSTHAVFETAGDKATVDCPVAAASVKFNADTTVLSGEGGTLTTPEINVAEGVTAEIAPPTSGPLAKSGKGTLKLGSSHIGETTLSEGNLVMTGEGTMLDLTTLTLGDGTTLRLENGASFSQVPGALVFGAVDDGSAKIYNSGDWSANGRLTLGKGRDSIDEYFHEGGALTLGERLQLGYNSESAGRASFTVSGGSIKLTSASHIYLGYDGAAGFKADMLVENDARVEVGYSIIVGNNNAASLTIKDNAYVVTGTENNGGYIAMAYNKGHRGGDCVLNLFGGTLETRTIEKNNATNATSKATVNFDGGTLKARSTTTTLIKADDNLTVTVGANGGTIDAAGYVVSIGEPLAGEGGMTFKGGGSITLASGNTYAGGTTVEIGTALCLSSLGDITGGITLSAPESLPDGVYTVVRLTGDNETFTEADLENLDAPEDSTLKLSADGKSVFCLYGSPANTWIGGASGSLCDEGNWSRNTVPSSSDEVIIASATEATLELPEGETFNVGSITFPKGSAKVTIGGEGKITGVTKIVNESGMHHEFLCEVDASASAPELPLDVSNYLVFTGGLKLSAMPSFNGMRLAGNWLVNSNWDNTSTPLSSVIVSGSTVEITGTIKTGSAITIEAGAKLKAANIVTEYGACAQFINQNYGTLEVTGQLRDEMVSSNANKSYSLLGFFSKASASAVTKVRGIVNAASTVKNHQLRLSNQSDKVENTIVLGEGGLSFEGNHRKTNTCYPYFQVDSGKSVRLASSADWTIAANSFKENGVTLEVLGTAIIDTSDYDDETAGHTITAAGRIGGTGQVNIAGCGKLLFEAENALTGGLTVTDTATAAFKEGANPPASCSIAVESGAALEVAESATVAISGNLSLKNGAIVAFNYSTRETPVLDLTSATLAYEEGESTNVTVRISAANRVRARTTANNENVLTTGGKFAGVSVSLDERSPDWARGVYVNGDGDIALKIQPLGTTFILK